LEDVLALIAQSALAQSLKSSRYVYPVVNAAHILGLGTLFGSILALDVRLLGAFRAIPVQPLARVLPRIAAAGLCVAVATGALLFTVEPQDYAANPAFLTKATLVAVAAAHALYLRRTAGWRSLLEGTGQVRAELRISAALSLTLWTAAIVAGRFIAF
jgi:hypothetical protein